MDQQARNAVRIWMRKVLQEKGWTAAEWARRAGTTPTNITRVLSPTATIVPKGETIALLARAAGSQPQLSPLEDVTASVQVPFLSIEPVTWYSASQFWKWILNETHPKSQIDRDPQRPAFVMAVPDGGMEGRGLVKGDRVLVVRIPIGQVDEGDVVVGTLGGRLVIVDWYDKLVAFRPSVTLAGQAQYKPRPSSEFTYYGKAISMVRDL